MRLHSLQQGLIIELGSRLLDQYLSPRLAVVVGYLVPTHASIKGPHQTKDLEGAFKLFSTPDQPVRSRVQV
jgi:hypothetical protein